ncbi:hypothetical protein [Phaeodactylibacter xiamenensis]|jgi:hypothetical protein|uniref:SURF1-like protein n=1 Tax=Phaeodactylibacter xiamenensis TaxID=1524460 RepID=A0A098RY88_9BACT|nr:hypothetical protein [Phaeodactylibacter xiamenensis]KGE84860.1 hypothetical protein IX84_31265 [Phaeodactylibacter xiamenensis]
MTGKELTKKEKIKRSQLERQLKNSKAERKSAIWIITLGIVFILIFGNMWINRNQEIKKDELILIAGTVSNKLELKREKSIGSSMIIQLDEYPRIDFKIGRFSAPGLKLTSLQNNIMVGDRIQIDILKDDYSNDRLSDQRTISVYGLRNDELEFLDVNSYNETRKKDRNSISMYLLLGFSFWVLGYGIYLKVKNEK